ncbi:hypothetical protein [uncultured Thiodictyon sp.]|uniref:NACHT domain-containing protein n=1 Tax=uncultured Thiodictyon sp. TaxID=1846217 RepID=UPI0025CEA09A|nr:hypothetical protein [uncultured Thiodictyon sp.]
MNAPDSIAEKNARVSARGEYMRWLAKRFGDLDLLLTMQGEDRVNLHKVYVPLRLDTQDRSDASMGGPDGVKDEKLPGGDALGLIAGQPFVAISGRPGSGKTTLIQAIISELAGDRPSEFRRKVVGERGILPIPLILRDYQDELGKVKTLNDLLECWWSKAAQEARDKGFELDLPRLRDRYSPDGDRFPLLLLFDGIDEVGGVAPRRTLLKLAVGASRSGYRAVVTGRPAGFLDQLPLDDWREVLLGDDLNRFMSDLFRAGLTAASTSSDQCESEWPLIELPQLLVDSALAMSARLRGILRPIQLQHIQPFAWPQVRDFIDRFFRLRQECQVERKRLGAEFHAALADPQHAHLLTLARRPIFLTLMALVHANDRRMPHVRADLYRRIVDLYLVRQTQQRRLVMTMKGEPMPHWDEREVRRALGYLAWRSQHRGAEAKNARERDVRQVIWERADLEWELCHLLSSEDPALGRFADIKPVDAPRLLDYFLHPIGLLVDPAEGRYQFVHLSFQEYLCAEYILGRAKALGSRRFLDGVQELLYKHLGLPGWDEVGPLLLCIHAAEGAQTDRFAHLELLAELDSARLPQAGLLVAALTGKELDYTDDELLRWLPVAAAAALVQPAAGLAVSFRAVPQWTRPGLEFLRGLFQAADPLDAIRARIDADPPGGLDAAHWQGHLLNGPLGARWRNPKGDHGWELGFGEDEGRAHALLGLANGSGWVPAEPGNEARVPLADPGLETAMLGWLSSRLRQGEQDLFYRRVLDGSEGLRFPQITTAAREIDCRPRLVRRTSPRPRPHAPPRPVPRRAAAQSTGHLRRYRPHPRATPPGIGGPSARVAHGRRRGTRLVLPGGPVRGGQ